MKNIILKTHERTHTVQFQLYCKAEHVLSRSEPVNTPRHAWWFIIFYSHFSRIDIVFPFLSQNWISTTRRTLHTNTETHLKRTQNTCTSADRRTEIWEICLSIRVVLCVLVMVFVGCHGRLLELWYTCVCLQAKDKLCVWIRASPSLEFCSTGNKWWKTDTDIQLPLFTSQTDR